MLDTFEILTTSGVVLWSRTLTPVSPAVINGFISDVFIEEKAPHAAAARESSLAAANVPYRTDSHTLRWAFAKDLGLIFVAVYRSLLNLPWVSRLVDNIRAIFVNLYGDQLTRPHTTLVECHGFDDYYDQQIKELEGASSDAAPAPADAAPRPLDTSFVSGNLGDDPPLAPPGLTFRGGRTSSSSGGGPGLRSDKSADSSPAVTPMTSRPSTPGGGAGHLLVAKPGGPLGKMSRRARKAQVAGSGGAPASSGDESSHGGMRKGSGAKTKTAKKGRKWDADGLADEDDGVQLDYSAANVASDSDFEPRSTGVDEVDASTWGSTTKGRFILKDLGDEVHSILEAEKSKSAAAAAAAQSDAPSGLLGSGLSTIGGLFRNVIGGKVLTKEDLDKAMKGMEDHLLRKNVAREAAVRLCEGVEKELVGVKTGSFESELVPPFCIPLFPFYAGFPS